MNMISNLQQNMLDAIETELQRQAARLNRPGAEPFHEMLTYHLGWTGEGAGPLATGKRIRPLLTLLTAAFCIEKQQGGNGAAHWRHAAPAAAAIELIHNFSLVHDDIQDNSRLRRGRDTVWVKWGAPMAINVGDALFVLANQSALDLAEWFPPETVVKAARILNHACLELTRGQYLDMAYEERKDLNLEDYLQMIGGKTSALLSACTHIGALLGNADEAEQETFRRFGYHLGLAFQMRDDILGIWGDEAETGKSVVSDLVQGKNSLPVIFGLERNGRFAKRWKQGPIAAREAGEVALMLAEEGGREFAENLSMQETQKALEYLQRTEPRGEAGETMLRLTNLLLARKQ